MPDLAGLEGGHRGAAEGAPGREATADVAGSHGDAQAARCEGAASAAGEGTPCRQLSGGGMQRCARCRVHAVQPSAQRQSQSPRPAPLHTTGTDSAFASLLKGHPCPTRGANCMGILVAGSDKITARGHSASCTTVPSI